ncbi:hypothetical protein SmJEL517_g02226 [Synchytrium microbalum]|uniref:NodB homology domain-containing protein n=1 Tax=Synchytrium microbalum TaxID=1806994 RepID=A0A507CBN6_9FUNG|nr:uncharacterized protein SmJEL517_g02226 [Synchytrium microbalum]TPX35364.1 hypothetical protein SmJEL517_g02226 [Synchytrium microbalum]
MVIGSFLLICAIAIITTGVECQKLVDLTGFHKGAYPPMDKIPPVDPTILAKYDLSKVPNYPPRERDRTTGDLLCPTTKGVWGLSFDDGPGPYTTGLLDFLDAVSVKVSMLTGVSTEQIVMEMHYSVLAIEQVTGTRPKYARPPLGDSDDRVRAIFAAMNLTCVIWDRDTYDWTSNDPSRHFQPQWITNNFTQWISAAENETTGHISLEHDLVPIAATEAPAALKLLLRAGFRVQSPAECIGDMRPYTNQSLVIPNSLVKGATGIGLMPTSGANRASSITISFVSAVFLVFHIAFIW